MFNSFNNNTTNIFFPCATKVKAHKFFSTINWDDLLRKNIPAPFIPKITSTMDVSNFSEEFTNMPVVDSPSVAPSANAAAAAVAPDAATAAAAVAANGGTASDANVFAGYSYVAPSVVLQQTFVPTNDLTLSEHDRELLFRPNPDKRPSPSNILGCKLSVSA